jgi:hypothetical protein
MSNKVRRSTNEARIIRGIGSQDYSVSSYDAVQNCIEASNRHGRPISRREAKQIHALLKGRH